MQRAIPRLAPEQLPFALSPPLLRTLVHSIDGERDGTHFVLKPAAAATVRALVRARARVRVRVNPNPNPSPSPHPNPNQVRALVSAAHESPALRIALVTQLLRAGLSGGGCGRCLTPSPTPNPNPNPYPKPTLEPEP